MASSNKDKTMEYKKHEKSKNHLAGRLNKFQETINRSQSPTPPVITSIHKSISFIHFNNNLKKCF
jgi:hypothetical protein